MPTRASGGFCLAAALTALSCGNSEVSDQTNEGGDVSATAGGAAGRASCNVDFSRFPTSEAASFRDGVLPIFGLSCWQSQCHDAIEPKAGMYLGPKCTPDSATEECTYNDPADPRTVLTDEDVMAVYENIVEVRSTTAPSLMRVAPRSPEASFLILKLSATHQQLGSSCSLQDPRAAAPCGDEMPPGGALCTQNQERFDLIADWIAQGAAAELAGATR